jgi:hypothetical protein
MEPGVPLKEDLAAGSDFLKDHAGEHGIRSPAGNILAHVQRPIFGFQNQGISVGEELKVVAVQAITVSWRDAAHHLERFVFKIPIIFVAFFGDEATGCHRPP